ncbi:uncharacterized protein V6R79_025963 [Siganus canaliculatus]
MSRLQAVFCNRSDPLEPESEPETEAGPNLSRPDINYSLEQEAVPVLASLTLSDEQQKPQISVASSQNRTRTMKHESRWNQVLVLVLDSSCSGSSRNQDKLVVM